MVEGMDTGPAAAEVDQILSVLESSLSAIKWRMKHSSKLRLQTDILALWTEMRPVIMVDYGGKMPELQERLCAFLQYCQQQCSAFELLRVMVIEEMIYLINVKALAEFVHSILNLERQTVFVDIEQDVPKIIAPSDNSLAFEQLTSLQKLFSEIFPVKTVNSEVSDYNTIDPKSNESSACGTSHSSSIIDLTKGVQETQVTIPTLNGWLLGYPVVYFFTKDHIQEAIYNLSTKSLNIFQILVSRSGTSTTGTCQELLSFTVPYDLSTEGNNEPWAHEFLDDVKVRWGRCKQVWTSLHLEVSSCYPQAIAL